MKDTEARFGVVTWSDVDDPFTWAEFSDNFAALARLAARMDAGLASARPGPSIERRMYVSLDTGAVDLDTGAEWLQLRPGAATGPPATGTYARGHQVRNSLPADGRPIGWVCVTAGAPGTWLPYGGIGTAASSGGGSTTDQGGTMDSTMGATA